MDLQTIITVLILVATFFLVLRIYQKLKMEESRAGVYATVNLVLHCGDAQALVTRFMGFRVVPRVGDTIRRSGAVFRVTQVSANGFRCCGLC